ncbi:MAG: pyridoxamine 5'-phosphate oxidase family protein [Oscillospiraceae bacterium]|nr:pyridoxamine 5'-phosphate oxidase family protein [Oscillospiraceae bacterium]
MSKTYEFLKLCDFFILTTINDSAPAARPFGATMEYEDELYFSTANTKDVYSQLIKNPSIQIVAKRVEIREWIRIDGKAIEINDLSIKQIMLDICPVLLKHFASNECNYFALFKILEMKSSLYTANGIVSLN